MEAKSPKEKPPLKERLKTLGLVGLFLVGLLIFAYPIFTRFYYRVESTRVISDFQEGKSGLTDEEIEERISLARAYNASLTGQTDFHDPYVDNVEEGVKNYARMIEVREKIGIVKVPSAGIEEPVFAGTSEDVLQRGVGHLEMTSLPVGGESTHTVLTGHRGLPEAKIFTDLDKVKEGDIVLVENIKETLAYEVDGTKVIEPNLWDDLLIRPGEDRLTLLTCTPYMINSHRLLIQGHRVPYTPELEEGLALAQKIALLKQVGLMLLILVLLGLMISLVMKRRREATTRRRRRR